MEVMEQVDELLWEAKRLAGSLGTFSDKVTPPPLESLEEKLDVGLDPNFFDEDGNLRDDVRKTLLKVKEDVLAGLEKKEVPVTPAFVVLTGSLCGPNWDEFSDIDLHIGVDFSQFDDPLLAKLFLAYYAHSFNQEGYDLLDRKLELYFQDTKETHTEPGLYDLVDGFWIKVPKGAKIEPSKAVRKAALGNKKKVEALQREYSKTGKDDPESFLNELRTYWEGIKRARKEGLSKEGEASFGNQVFKQLRRSGTLEVLAKLIRQVVDDTYEVKR